MKKGVFIIYMLSGLFNAALYGQEYRLVWSDEFNTDGKVDTTNWNFARGFQYNKEAQWYQTANAYCKDGKLIIEARKEHSPNPDYDPDSEHWGKKRLYVEYTSSRLNTAEKREFLYGRFEIRAKIPTAKGAWPAFWTLGTGCEYGGIGWPQCGEIDIMEYYPVNGEPHVLGNVGWGTDQHMVAKWRDKRVPLSHFLAKDPQWKEKFHIWRMDWDSECIRLYLDDELINETFTHETINVKLADGYNPFKHPHYILLNLALGGVNGGPIDDTAFPMKFEIDYVRVYQK